MTFQVLVDWDNNGNFTDTYDDITADVARVKWRIGMRSAYQEMGDENTATVTVRNNTGKYNPENASSPLFGNLLPHRPMQIQFVNGGTTIMWRGWIEWPDVVWQPSGDYTAKTNATILGIGAKTYLEDLEVTTDYYEDVTGDVIIEDILTDTGMDIISTDFSQIETGLTVLDYFGDPGTDRRSVYGLLEEITAAERGRFFIDRQGRPAWWNRHRLLLDSTNDASVDDASGDYKPTLLNYAYGRMIANLVRVTSTQRQVGNSETLWQLDQSYTVPPNQSQSFEVRLRKSTGQFAASGALVATPTFSSSSCTVNVTERGGKAIVELDNTGNAVPCVLSGLTLSGAPVVTQNQMTIETTDAASIADYGKRGLNIDLGPISNFTDARYVGEYELNRRKYARGDVSSITYLRKADGTDNAHMLAWTMGTRLGITLLNGHDANYFIIGEEHEWRENQIHETTYHLENALTGSPTGGFWILGVAGASELGETTTLGY